MRGAVWLVVVGLFVCTLAACGGAHAETRGKDHAPKAAAKAAQPPSPEPNSQPSAASDESSAAAPQAAASAPAPVVAAAYDDDALKLPVEVPLAAEVNAGVISRSKLAAVLAQGIGQFFRSVRTEPNLMNGRFAGWRILSLFADQPGTSVSVLRLGDTVRRANGQSLERPETFKAVWDGLATAKELVLDIERGGRKSKLRFTIAD